jgi:hypothetical protein
MPNDPGLEADTCIYIEAVAGDNGVHSTNGVWWLSPDIQLTGPTSGADKADPGQANDIQVTVRRRPDGSNCTLPPGTESISVEVWAGNPSLVMTPDNLVSTFKIDTVGTVLPLSSPDPTNISFVWSPPSGLPPEDPQGPGHKCLIARCYPDPLTPSAINFFVPDDPHVAQRNLCVVPCGDGPGAAKAPGPCGLEVRTMNPDLKREAAVVLSAAFDPEPTGHVRRTVLERLRRTAGFSRLAVAPPRGLRLILPDFPTQAGAKRPHPPAASACCSDAADAPRPRPPTRLRSSCGPDNSRPSPSRPTSPARASATPTSSTSRRRARTGACRAA